MSAHTEEALALANEIADAFRELRSLPQRKYANAARLLRALSGQLERAHSEIFSLRDEAQKLRQGIELLKEEHDKWQTRALAHGWPSGE